MIESVDEKVCAASAPEALGWLRPPAVCALPVGHEGSHDDKAGAFWTDSGSYGVSPHRYFGSAVPA